MQGKTNIAGLYYLQIVMIYLHFWSKSTGIPISNFKKSSIDRRQDKKKLKNGKLPFGTAHLLIKSNGNKDFGVLLARKINAWMNEVLK